MPALRPLVVGANHRSAPLGLRDALFVDDAAQPRFLATLGLAQAIALSTCDRVEVWAIDADPALAERRIVAALAHQGGLPVDALTEPLYRLTDQAAVRHCFKVTASLDSQVIGEPHVLGQVKACHRLAREAGLCGAGLEGLLAAAYGAAKRVRSETEVGLRPVSIAAVAVRLAQDLHGALAETRVLLLGAGDMGELVAEHLLAAGVKRLMVMAPRLKSAETLAQSLGAQSLHVQVASFEQLGQRLIDADIVVSAVGARQATLSAEQVGLALRRRRRQPMFLIDTAIPGDIEPAANRLEGAYLYDLADLERLAMAGRATRASAAQQALVIVDEMVEAFFLGRAERHAVPAILLLRQHAETLRRQALTDAGGDAEEATRLLVNRLLHDPSDVMKQLAAGEQGWPAAEELLKQLFRLPG